MKQNKSSRLNGAKSRGPVNAKLAEERNALRYRLLAETVVLPGESNSRFIDMVQAMSSQWRPASESEAALIDTMAMSRWRQLRVVGLQTSGLALGMSRQQGPAPNRALDALRDQDHALTVLQRDEIVYDRQYNRALRMLILLKEQRHRPGPIATFEITATGATWEPDAPPEDQDSNPPSS